MLIIYTKTNWRKVSFQKRGIFLDFYFYVRYSTLLHQISLCRRMLGSNPGLLRLAYLLSNKHTFTRFTRLKGLQSDALTTWLDFIHKVCHLIQLYKIYKIKGTSVRRANHLARCYPQGLPPNPTLQFYIV